MHKKDTESLKLICKLMVVNTPWPPKGEARFAENGRAITSNATSSLTKDKVPFRGFRGASAKNIRFPYIKKDINRRVGRDNSSQTFTEYRLLITDYRFSRMKIIICNETKSASQNSCNYVPRVDWLS